MIRNCSVAIERSNVLPRDMVHVKKMCYCALNEPLQDQGRTAPDSHTNNYYLTQDVMCQRMMRTV